MASARSILAIRRVSIGRFGNRVRFSDLAANLSDQSAQNHVAVRHTGSSSSDSNVSFRREVQSNVRAESQEKRPLEMGPFSKSVRSISGLAVAPGPRCRDTSSGLTASKSSEQLQYLKLHAVANVVNRLILSKNRFKSISSLFTARAQAPEQGGTHGKAANPGGSAPAHA